MRWRVVLQLIALCLVMAALFFSVRLAQLEISRRLIHSHDKGRQSSPRMLFQR